jgi:hypothetical protein
MFKHYYFLFYRTGISVIDVYFTAKCTLPWYKKLPTMWRKDSLTISHRCIFKRLLTWYHTADRLADSIAAVTKTVHQSAMSKALIRLLMLEIESGFRMWTVVLKNRNKIVLERFIVNYFVVRSFWKFLVLQVRHAIPSQVVLFNI